jgi:hypothetical protein
MAENPEWIIGDSDALVQLIVADALSPLKILKSSYGIQTVIPEPVEVELRRVIGSKRFQDMRHVLTKALDTGLLKTLDRSLLSTLVGNKAIEMFPALEKKGEQLRKLGIGPGEAYSHAASMALQLPIISNDGDAIRKLLGGDIHIQPHLLRSYDVLTFGVQIGNLSHNDCDGVRQDLNKRGDEVPVAFRKRSFTDSLPYFFSRLIDGSEPIIGSEMPIVRYDVRLVVSKVTRDSVSTL